MHQNKASGRPEKRSPANGGMSSIFAGGLCCTLIYNIRCESRASGSTQTLGLRWDFETTSKIFFTGLVPIACYTLIDKGLKTVQVFRL